jgi:hypothetical protein
MYPRHLADARSVRQRDARGLAGALPNHEVSEARAYGWDTLRHGELLAAAESEGFDVDGPQPPTPAESDRSKVAVVVLTKTRWRLIQLQLSEVAAAVKAVSPGTLVSVEIRAR